MKKLMFVIMFIISFQSHSMISGTGYISQVVDGDTFVIKTDNESLVDLINSKFLSNKKYNYNNKTFVMRIANMDTAESVHVNSNRNSQEGYNISSIIKNEFTNKRIKYKCFNKGYYGRAICSFTYSNKDYGTMLLERGYSQYVTKFGKHPYLHNTYRATTQNIAHKNGKKKTIGSYIRKARSAYEKYKNIGH